MTTSNKSARKLLEANIRRSNFGSFLRVARISMDLTQEQFGRILGISKSVVCDLEKGRQTASLKLAHRIAKKAGLSEILAVQLCIQDQLRAAKIAYTIDLKKAA